MSIPTFEDFVVTHSGELVAFARRLTVDHHQAEDLVQNVLARVGLSWEKVGHVGDPRAYVFKAVLREFLSWRRRLSSRERPSAAPATVADGGPAVDERVAQRAELGLALARLAPVQRAVLVLRYYHDRPDAEIARLLGCRETTVRSHAHRALTVLRDHGVGRDTEPSGRRLTW